MKYLAALLLICATPFVHAETKTCRLCLKIDAASKNMQPATEFGRRKILRVLAHANLSKDSDVRSREITKLLDLSKVLIPKDESGESDEYLSALYDQAPKEFDSQIQKLSPKDQKVIRDSLKHTEEVQKHGNG